MKSLIPTENWEYGISDVIYGLIANFGQKSTLDDIQLDKITNSIPIRSGRAAIVSALEALNLPKNASIAVPLYSCPVVFKAIKDTGYKPVFIDIERDTFCMSTKDLSIKAQSVHAVIVIHMFGNVCDIPRLASSVKNKPIIEDCAQSLGSKLNGKSTGLYGTIGIYSFRSGKYLSVGEGGSVYAALPDIRSNLLEIISQMPKPTHSEEFMHIIKTYIRSKLRRRPLYGFLGYHLWQYYNRIVDYSEKTPIVLRQIFRSDHRLTKKRLYTLDKVIERQREIADIYINELEFDRDMLCLEKKGTYYNRFMFPILFSTTEKRDRMIEYLRIHNIDTSKPYQDIPEIAAKYYGYNGDCPITESITKRIIVIPSYFCLKKSDVQKIVRNLNAGWKYCRIGSA